MAKACINLSIEFDEAAEPDMLGIRLGAEMLVDECFEIGNADADGCLCAVENALKKALRQVEARAALVGRSES